MENTPDNVKRLLLGDGMDARGCKHQGYLVPMEMAPVPVLVPGQKEGEKVQLTIWKTLSSMCIRCGHVFGHFQGAIPGVQVPPAATDGPMPPFPTAPPSSPKA